MLLTVVSTHTMTEDRANRQVGSSRFLKRHLPILAIVLLLVSCWAWMEFQAASSLLDSGLDNVSLVSPTEYFKKEREGTLLLDYSGQVELDKVLLPAVSADDTESVSKASSGYVGPQVCAECHQDYYDSFIETSHFKTAALPSTTAIKGSFAQGKNSIDTLSANLSFEMRAKEDGFFQRAIYQRKDKTYSADFPFDLIAGSGKIGQSYCYWVDDHLFQLQVSYFTASDSWMNSPGFPDGVANFARPILPRCLECHTTYFQAVGDSLNQYRRDNFVLGVTCEKCHGSGKEHVDYHRQHPDAEAAHAIVNPANLTTQRALDNCQLCHGGDFEKRVQPAFSYRPGEPLEDYYTFKKADELNHGLHSNAQLPPLRRSKCFQESEAMTCVTCHNPHQFERGNFELFSNRCQECHEPHQCGKFDQLGDQIQKNCIDCHMRRRGLEDIKLLSIDGDQVPHMRDHLIGIWKEESEEYIKALGN